MTASRFRFRVAGVRGDRGHLRIWLKDGRQLFSRVHTGEMSWEAELNEPELTWIVRVLRSVIGLADDPHA